MKKALATYRKKRNFAKTKEPKPLISSTVRKKKIFVIQKHYATKLHYDLRIEIDGVLKSWAIPKRPYLKKGEKKLAIQTEDHPLAYASFSGKIPEGEYGAGTVTIWDAGYYQNIKTYKNKKEFPMKRAYKKGLLEVFFQGKRIQGPYALVRFQKKNWLFLKMKKKL